MVYDSKVASYVIGEQDFTASLVLSKLYVNERRHYYEMISGKLHRLGMLAYWKDSFLVMVF